MSSYLGNAILDTPGFGHNIATEGDGELQGSLWAREQTVAAIACMYSDSVQRHREFRRGALVSPATARATSPFPLRRVLELVL